MAFASTSPHGKSRRKSAMRAGRHSRTLAVATLSLGLAAGGGAVARAAGDTSTSTGKADRAFLTEAASAGLMEVELGRVATTHAASERVKQLGQRMIDDHRKANADMKKFATRESITLPDTMMEDHREMTTRLSKLQGPAFDQAYMQAMVKDHEEDVAKFREQARSAADPDVKAFATKTLPTLENHLRMAKEISGTAAGDAPVSPKIP